MNMTYDQILRIYTDAGGSPEQGFMAVFEAGRAVGSLDQDGDPTPKDAYRRMFHATCADLGLIGEKLRLDPEGTGGAGPILHALDQIALTMAGRTDPITWINEDQLPEGYPYDELFPYSKVDGVRMFPVFGPAKDKYGEAYLEWTDKTEFIQDWMNQNKLSVKYLGWHRADVMRDLIQSVAPAAQPCESMAAWLVDHERLVLAYKETIFDRTGEFLTKRGAAFDAVMAHARTRPAAEIAEPAAGDTYLCKAWGESDIPAAAIVTGLKGVKAFLVSEWLGSADVTQDDGTNYLDAVAQEMQELWANEGDAWEWSTEFEVGGVSVQKVGHVAVFTSAMPDAQGDERRALPMDTAPRNGTLVRLLVKFEEHQLEDHDAPQWTIGHNNHGNTGEDVWQFAGWCWTHDHFAQGEGTAIGWLPLLESAAPSRQPSAPASAGEVELPAHEPTIAIQEILDEYVDPDDREDAWDSIQAYADIHARAALAAAKPEEPLSPDESALFVTTVESFEESVDSTAGLDYLMRWASMGLLECTRFEVTKKGVAAYAAAKPEGSRDD